MLEFAWRDWGNRTQLWHDCKFWDRDSKLEHSEYKFLQKKINFYQTIRCRIGDSVLQINEYWFSICFGKRGYKTLRNCVRNAEGGPCISIWSGHTSAHSMSSGLQDGGRERGVIYRSKSELQRLMDLLSLSGGRQFFNSHSPSDNVTQWNMRKSKGETKRHEWI